MNIKELTKWVGKIGWVTPYSRCTSAQIAVKVVGAQVSYGRWLLEVEPMMGVGTWLVGFDRVNLERGEGL